MKKKLLIVMSLVLLTMPTILPFFNSKFFYTQDYIFIARLNQLSVALSDGSFPVRWAPDLRYGEPIFNYYAALPYYLGFLIHLLGFNFIWVAKILFILSTFLSALTMFIFIQKLFGKKAAFLSSALYTYAPYRAVDLYVRGALSEAWAFVFFPLIFYTALFLSEKINLKRIAYLSLALSGLFLTHNVSTLMFLPFFALFVIYLILKEKNWVLLFPFLLSIILGLSLSSFFILPATFERDFIQTKYLTVGYFDFRAHFVAVSQFFSTFWGYGSSLWGRDDGLSFQVGLANWVMIILAGILSLIYRKDKKILGLFGFLAVSFLLSMFLQHNRSAFIWEMFPVMAFIQFPWRFLSISILFSAIIGGAVTPYFKGRLNLLYLILLMFVIFSSLFYFKPKEYVADSFFEKFLNKEIMKTGADLTKDYLPIWVKTTDAPPLNYPESQSGEITVLKFEKRTAYAFSQINVFTDSVIEVPITFFPGWTAVANGQVIKLENPGERGLIKFKLPVGSYDLQFEFRDTPVRMTGNYTSLFSAAILAAFLTLKFKNV